MLTYNCPAHLISLDLQSHYTEIADEVDELKNEKHEMLVKKALDEDKKRRIRDKEEFPRSQSM